MELLVVRSRIHLILICFCFALGFTMVGFSGLAVAYKPLGFLVLAAMVFFELKSWWFIPTTISLRREKLIFSVNQIDSSEPESFVLSQGRAHRYWIGFPRGKLKTGIFLFRDSFSATDWNALQRAVRNQ